MKKTYLLEGLECANCATKMEKAIGALDGVQSASVRFLTARMVLEMEDDKVEAIEKAAVRIIRKLEPDTRMKEIQK